MSDKRPKILVIDDEKTNLNILADLLRPKFKVVLAKNHVQAFERLRSDSPPDLILLDIILPEMDGYEILENIKRDELLKNIPVIFITALECMDEEAKGLELGAADFIRKPFHPPIIKARVENQLTILRQRKLLENLANLDGLTEMPNRRSFEIAFDKEWRRCKRSNSALSLAILDVDCFKQYNDNYGHHAGDEVLKKVARVLIRESRRSGDFAARYGGEEFALILPETAARGAIHLAEKIRKAIVDLNVAHDFTQTGDNLTISVGGVSIIPDNSESKKIREMADKMLYEAKRTGRNKVVWKEII